MLELTPDIVNRIVKNMPPEEAADLLAMFDVLEERKRVDAARTDFLAFIAAIDKNYKFGAHLRRLGHLLMDVEENTKNRIAVSMAPRMASPR